MQNQRTQIILGGVVGNVIEWYNFMVYGFLASQMGMLFFPKHDAMISLMLAYALFALGFVARPLGGIIFGFIGDHYGRQRALLSALICMLLPTLAIACLPTYQVIGIWSPVLLLLCRILQGISIGGEYTGSAIYMEEIAPAKRKGLWISIVPATTAVGVLLGSATAWLTSLCFSNHELLTWAWRLPFALGVVIAAAGIYLRLNLPETPAFTAIVDKRQSVWRQLMQADALRSFLLLIGLVICYSVFYQILYIWMPGFLEVNLHYSASAVLGLNTINMVIFVGSILLFGYVSDYVPLQRLLIIASSLLLLLSYPFFLWILQAQSLWLIAVGLVIMTLIFGMYAASTTRQVVNLFPISNRYTGLSLGYNLAYAIFGGTTPLMVTWLVKATGQLHSPAYYLMACALLVSVLMLLTKRQMAK